MMMKKVRNRNKKENKRKMIVLIWRPGKEETASDSTKKYSL